MRPRPLIVAMFTLAACLTGCDAERKRQEATSQYISTRLEAARAEDGSGRPGRSTDAATAAYWRCAVEAVAAWNEAPANLDANRITDEVGRFLRGLDASGVDADAVRGVEAIATGLIRQRELLFEAQVKAGSAVATDVLSTPPAGFDPMTGQAVGGSAPAVGIGSAIGNGIAGTVELLAATRQARLSADAVAEECRGALNARLALDLPPLQIRRPADVGN